VAEPGEWRAKRLTFNRDALGLTDILFKGDKNRSLEFWIEVARKQRGGGM